MKSRSSSPQTSPQVVRRYRVEGNKETGGAQATSPRKTSLRIEQLPTINMTGFQPSNGTPTSTPRDASPGLLGPMTNGLRKVSNDQINTPLRPTPNGIISSTSIPTLSSPGTDNDSPSATPWSSAVGHATTAGKSGRVIERLMAENDKLKRELELSILKVQELERNAQTYKPQLDAMREKIDSLSHVRDMDSSLISRRDRKIEEQKADLAQERQDKVNLQRRLKEVERSSEDVREQYAREHQGMLENTKHATVHAEILETSHKQLAAEYRTRRDAWEHDLAVLQEEREQDRLRLARLDVVYEQMRQETERTRKIQADLVARWEDMEKDMHHTLDEGDEANQQARKKSAEMESVVNEMRWLMGVEKSSRKDSRESSD